IWKLKKLIKSLESARGNGTSMISLILPANGQICRASKMLVDEMGTAANIKSRVNRQSVQSAIASVQQRLKLYPRMPANGLVIYCGTLVTEEGKDKKVNIDLEPFKPIHRSLYMCDNRFHIEVLKELLVDDNKFGFIVMDGNGALFGTLEGNTRQVLQKFSVGLPKKHGRGGQSALRFARLRDEKRHNYVRKVAEVAQQVADFKTQLYRSDLFDRKLQALVVRLVDVSYGGENGFNEAIKLSAEVLSGIRFVDEKRLINRYLDEISQDTGKYCFGVEDTIKALEMGAVEVLIVWENLDITRYVLKNPNTNEEKIVHEMANQERNGNLFVDTGTGVELEVLEVLESMSLLEWFANNYTNFGAILEFVSDSSQEGSQFVKGFGGVGGILRYKVHFQDIDFDNIIDEFEDLDI
ncbi:unnamed protein product, partial [Oppiella nova]